MHLTVVHNSVILIIVGKNLYIRNSLFKKYLEMIGEQKMPIRYKINIMDALKEKGYSSYRLRKEKIFGQKTIQDFRDGTIVLSQDLLSKLCELLDCQPGDLIEYSPDKP